MLKIKNLKTFNKIYFIKTGVTKTIIRINKKKPIRPGQNYQLQ